MTLSDGRATTVCVGDVGNVKGNHQFRVLKTIAPSGPIVLKRTAGSTYRSFLRTPAHAVISASPMVNRSTQTDPPPSTTDDHLAQAILQCCRPDAVEAYHPSCPHCLRANHWITLAEIIKSAPL